MAARRFQMRWKACYRSARTFQADFYCEFRNKKLKKHENIINYLKPMNYGSTSFLSLQKDLVKIQMPIPPIEEQKQIVTILDKAFAVIDQAKANIEQNIVNAKELFQSKLNDIFSQKGDGWEDENIEVISTVVNGYSFKSKDFSADNEIKSIKITNVGIMKFIEDSSNNLPATFLQEYSKVKVYEGNLVLALTRIIISGGLKVARVPKSCHNSLLNQRVAAIVPDEDLIDSNYVYYYFSSDIVYNYVLDNVNTLMQPNLSINDLKKMTVPITSIGGQRKISAQIEDLSKKINSLICNYEVKLANLEELKKSILQKAFAGELTSPEGTKYTKDGSIPSTNIKTKQNPERVL
jgi:type I restriction enzyme S subunit